MLSVPLKKKLFGITRRVYEKRCKNHLKANEGLWDILQDYLKKTDSTGCNYGDYYQLYKYVKTHRPQEILECGTGVTTIVLAYALAENIKEKHSTKAQVTSMEDQSEWYEVARKLLPDPLKKIVNLTYSPRSEACYSIYRGVCYKEVPDLKYDFAFIDGPGTTSPTDGTRAFDFDYINLILKSDRPIPAIIDKRIGTCYVLQKLLGVDRVTFNPVHNLGYVKASGKKDLKMMGTSECFEKSFKLIRPTRLHLEIPR